MSSDEITKEELSRFGRFLASRRRTVEGECEVCGKATKGTTKRRYCSNTCAARVYRERRRHAASDQEQTGSVVE
jgi:hypothetical protein